MSSATPQSYIAVPLSNACSPSSVAFSVYDSNVILSGFNALHFRVKSSGTESPGYLTPLPIKKADSLLSQPFFEEAGMV